MLETTVRCASDELVSSLITILKQNPMTSTRALQAMVKEFYCKRNAVSAQEIFNLRVRIQLVHEKMKVNEDAGLIDDASWHIHSIQQSVLKNRSTGWKLLKIPGKMHAKTSGFTYCIIRDKNGDPTGVVWIPQMQSNYKLFGSFISIDAMKRQQSSLHWSYITSLVLDKRKTIAVIAKSIVIEECCCILFKCHLSCFCFIISRLQLPLAPSWTQRSLKQQRE